VIFDSEAARDRAIETCKDGVDHEGSKLYLHECLYEPDSVIFKNFTNSRWEKWRTTDGVRAVCAYSYQL